MRCEPEDQSRVARTAARLDVCDGREEPSCSSRAVCFSGPEPEPRIGHPRSQACETCGGTAPYPASATPRERAPRRARMHNDIAKVRATVKNKVGTLPLPPHCHSGAAQRSPESINTTCQDRASGAAPHFVMLAAMDSGLGLWPPRNDSGTRLTSFSRFPSCAPFPKTSPPIWRTGSRAFAIAGS